MYDLIIIGGGPAAISAGIYAARKKMKTLLLTKTLGGQVAGTALVENYPGFISIDGRELVDRWVKHLKDTIRYGLVIQENIAVKQIKWENEYLIELKTEKDAYQTKALIIATGRKPRKLGVPGEDEFANKGVSYCSICDAPLFKDKKVAVVGGGNAGMEAALDLTKYASQIYLLEKDSQLTGDECFQERVKQDTKVKVLTKVLVKEIKGDGFVKGLTYKDLSSGQIKEIAVEGIFVDIGSIPNSLFVKDVIELNQWGEIKIDSHNRTSKSNIFAAGDVTNISHKQIVIAVGEGAKAALNVYDYLQSHSGSKEENQQS